MQNKQTKKKEHADQKTKRRRSKMNTVETLQPGPAPNSSPHPLDHARLLQPFRINKDPPPLILHSSASVRVAD